MAVLLLSGCYLCLFGPRNEYLSFLVLTPALTALAFLLLATDKDDWLMMTSKRWQFIFDRVMQPGDGSQ